MIIGAATTLMNRLKCASKMLLISVVFLIPILTTLTFLVVEQLGAIHFAKRERLGIEYVALLMKLVQHLPEHRGMQRPKSWARKIPGFVRLPPP